jgi:hypothetical protein
MFQVPHPPTKATTLQDSVWHSASCRIPTSSYTYSVQQQERFLQQQIAQQHSALQKQAVLRAAVPTIKVTIPPRDRRTSISSPLRFVRTVSTDSIDSLERQCLRDLRVQQMMERPRLVEQSSLVEDRQRRQLPMQRQLSYDPRGAESKVRCGLWFTPDQNSLFDLPPKTLELKKGDY